jgi:hypothetical protein
MVLLCDLELSWSLAHNRKLQKRGGQRSLPHSLTRTVHWLPQRLNIEGWAGFGFSIPDMKNPFCAGAKPSVHCHPATHSPGNENRICTVHTSPGVHPSISGL